ncbi:protein of unknown function [Magnetospirillum sp. XM-1]|uniref:hypothetical protein n=1 Tax=Magnetospirillum sp. XM-1 TaxID=1663591 RepID=UPI00073DC186|nr:hypothetical protein [Magnetospirillum sp. XM-1]CUW38816.1 protein of unknown function [Magnetospirillum sp. XM-1]
MKQYNVTLTGLTPLLMHQDNLSFGEKIKAWQKDPANKELSTKGDDRSPAWTWMGYAYHDTRVLGIPSDNLMTCIREGATKVPSKGKATYKKQSQAGLAIDQQQWDLRVNGKTIDFKALWSGLMGENDFARHIDEVEAAGFELFIKRAKVNSNKHVRVRPMLRTWEASGSFTVFDDETSGLTLPVLTRIFEQAGAYCGLGDWRPSSPQSSGSFGKFTASLSAV